MSNDSGTPVVVGRGLLDYANSIEEGPKHGRVIELFPFIFDASHKLGIRAISRWLAEQNTPVSPATISRGLKNPDGMLSSFTGVVQMQANRIAECYKVPIRSFLFGDPDEFASLISKSSRSPKVQALSNCTQDECDFAISFLQERWFVLSQSTREYCRQFLVPYAGEEDIK